MDLAHNAPIWKHKPDKLTESPPGGTQRLIYRNACFVVFTTRSIIAHVFAKALSMLLFVTLFGTSGGIFAGGIAFGEKEGIVRPLKRSVLPMIKGPLHHGNGLEPFYHPRFSGIGLKQTPTSMPPVHVDWIGAAMKRAISEAKSRAAFSRNLANQTLERFSFSASVASCMVSGVQV
jgi:hypothetical protein